MKKTIPTFVIIAVAVIAIVIFVWLCTRGDKDPKNYMKVTGLVGTRIRGEFYNQNAGTIYDLSLPTEDWQYYLQQMLDFGNINQIQHDDDANQIRSYGY